MKTNLNIDSEKNKVTEDSHKETCIPMETVISNVNLARAYVPFQKFCTTNMPNESLRQGTVFPELNRPFIKESKNLRPSKQQ